MNSNHRDILREHRTYLIKEIDEEHLILILGYLMAHNIILSTQKEIIDSEQTHTFKCGTFLDILPKRGSKAFRIFIDGLNELGLGHVASKLIDANEGYDAPYTKLECESFVEDNTDQSNFSIAFQEEGDLCKGFAVVLSNESNNADIDDLLGLFNRASYKVFRTLNCQFPANEIAIVLLLDRNIDKIDLQRQLIEQFSGKKALIFTTLEDINVDGCYIFLAPKHDIIVKKLKTFFLNQRVNFDIRDMIKRLKLGGTNNIHGNYFHLEWRLH